MPGPKRMGDVIHRKEAVTTWREHLELHHKEHAMKVCLVGGAIKVCLVDSFIPPSATFQDSRHHGYPGGCNEGVDSYKKVLSKRGNMCNSCGNRGNESI